MTSLKWWFILLYIYDIIWGNYTKVALFQVIANLAPMPRRHFQVWNHLPTCPARKASGVALAAKAPIWPARLAWGLIIEANRPTALLHIGRLQWNMHGICLKPEDACNCFHLTCSCRLGPCNDFFKRVFQLSRKRFPLRVSELPAILRQYMVWGSKPFPSDPIPFWQAIWLGLIRSLISHDSPWYWLWNYHNYGIEDPQFVFPAFLCGFSTATGCGERHWIRIPVGLWFKSLL